MPLDPFATPTVARIYAQQGRFDEALKIYRQLVRQRPGDPTLSSAMAELEARMEQAPQTATMPLDRVDLELRAADRLRCQWAISPAGQERAQLVLGAEEGLLTLRLAGFPEPDEAASSDLTLDEPQGHRTLTPAPGTKLLVAAVGLLGSDGTFVSIAHSDMLKL